MKLSMAELKEYFESKPELKRLNQKDLPDDDFAEIIKNNFNENNLDENLINYIINQCESRFNFNKIESEFEQILPSEFSKKNKDIIISMLKIFIIFKSLNLPLREKDNNEIINLVTTFNKFQEEANFRINQLKNDLSKKYEAFDKYIDFHFTNFINVFNEELLEREKGFNALNNMELFGINVFNSLSSKQGRPKDLLFDVFLLKINEFGDNLCPDDKYAKLIKPFFSFIAINYPKLIDLNDVNDTNKLRQRIIYLKSLQIPTVE